MSLQRTGIRSILTLILSAVLVVPAQAQLGGLARRAKDAAKDAAKDKVEEALPYTPSAPPAFNDRVLEITTPRLDGLMKGFAAEVAYAATASGDYKDQVKAHERAVADYEKALPGYEKAQEKWNVCATDFHDKEAAAGDANERKAESAIEGMGDEEFGKKLEDLARRGEEIAREVQSGKTDPETIRKHEEYQKEANAFSAEQMRRTRLAMEASAAENERVRSEDPRLKAACGEAPKRPVQPISAMAGPEGVLAAKGAEAAGLNAQQYAIMRERVLFWVSEKQRPKRMGFAATEIEVLDAKADGVVGMVDSMKKAKVPI